MSHSFIEHDQRKENKKNKKKNWFIEIPTRIPNSIEARCTGTTRGRVTNTVISKTISYSILKVYTRFILNKSKRLF